MTEFHCETAREWIPDYVARRLDAPRRSSVAAHLDACAECAEEAELASLLLGSIPAPPSGLADRVRGAIARDRRSGRRPWWGLSAAAVAALALGIGLANDRADGPGPVVPAYAYEADGGELWPSDDGLIAGAPVFDDLSDEALGQLLDELDSGRSGGAA
jgi:ferric-dicitrate binding protein FerR (iron transport regulator)